MEMTLPELLRGYRYTAHNEAALQAGVERVLQEQGIGFEREKSLSPRDRIEFYLPEARVGIECKIDGSQIAVMRQLLRYAESDRIEELILLTSRNKHRSVPETLHGKPVHIVYVGGF